MLSSPSDESRYYGAGKHSYMLLPDDRFAEFIVRRCSAALTREYDRALEIGAGMGRFSGPLSRRHKELTLVEPVPDYAELLRKKFENTSVTILESVMADVAEALAQKKDWLVCTYHVMHHLTEAQRAEIFDFVARTESTGILCEPNPLNPLFPIQIAIVKEMSWAEERQYLQLTFRRYEQELKPHGLKILNKERICFLPPFVVHRALRLVSAEKLERGEILCRLLPFIASYVTVTYGRAR